MRHLFVPACLCVMTVAGTTAIESNKLPIEKLFGASRVSEKPEGTGSPSSVASGAPVEIPAQTGIDPLHVPLPPIAKPVVHRSREEVCDTLAQSAQSNDLPLPFFIRLLFQESRFQPEAVSAAGAEGVAQFMPETSADRGLENPYDPVQAISASARLLRDLKQQFGNLGLAAAAYNAGPKRIQDWLAKKGKLPEETQGYVKIITGRPAENWKAAAAVAPGVKLPRHAPCQEAVGLYAWNGPDRIPIPVPSPNTRKAAASVQVTLHTAAPSSAPAKPNAAAKVVSAPMKVSAAVKVASVKIEKPAGKAVVADGNNSKGVVQLAARKVSKPKVADKTEKVAAKPDQVPHKTAGKPIELAAAQR